MSENKPKGIDYQGAARLLDERARRWAPVVNKPGLPECMRLLVRNPEIAPVILNAIEAELCKLPGGGVRFDRPVFDAQGRPAV